MEKVQFEVGTNSYTLSVNFGVTHDVVLEAIAEIAADAFSADLFNFDERDWFRPSVYFLTDDQCGVSRILCYDIAPDVEEFLLVVLGFLEAAPTELGHILEMRKLKAELKALQDCATRAPVGATSA
jgi:hypothetical protein